MKKLYSIAIVAGLCIASLTPLFLRMGAVANSVEKQPLKSEPQKNALVEKQEDRPLHPKRQANLLFEEGKALFDEGELAAALEKLEAALVLYRSTENRFSEGRCLALIGVIKAELTYYQGDISAYEQSAEIFREIDNIYYEILTRQNIGWISFNLAEYEKALEVYNETLELLENIGEENIVQASEEDFGYPSITARTLSLIGQVHLARGEYDRALELADRALEMAQKTGDREGEGVAIHRIGQIYHDRGQYPQAQDYYQQSLQIKEEIGDRFGQAVTLNSLGLIHDSKDYFYRALTIYQELGETQGQATVLANIALFYEKQGNIPQAISSYQQSIDAFESIRGELKISELVASFAEQLAKIYERQIDLLWQSGRFEEAFHAVERSRAQAFLNQMAQGSIDFRSGTAANLLEQEQLLRAEITALRTQRLELLNLLRSDRDSQTIKSNIDQLESDLEELEKKYQRFLVQLKVQNHEYADLITGEVASLATIQKQLPADKILLEYFVTEKRTFAFIVSQNSFKTISLEVSRQELREDIELFRNFINRPNPHPIKLKKLHQRLISPLTPYLNTAKIAVVPHNVLHYLPFAALTDGEKYFSEDYVLSTLPSASTLPYLEGKRKPKTGSLLAVGNPQLDERLCKIKRLCSADSAGEAAKAIAEMYGTEALIGAEATETAVKSQAVNSEIIHLGAHGEYSKTNPLFSTLYLTEDSQNDGLMEVHEIYDLDLSLATNLVVMSACETQIGNLSATKQSSVSPGDEIVALNRAFLFAGTPNVIGTLWSIQDQESGLVMELFYAHLQNMSSEEALRQAQIDFRAKYPDKSHPYYWSAFVLTGDGL